MQDRRCSNPERHEAHTWAESWHGKRETVACPGNWDQCLSCKDARAEQGLEPASLTQIGITKNKNLPVFACGVCDGNITETAGQQPA